MYENEIKVLWLSSKKNMMLNNLTVSIKVLYLTTHKG